eukprot:10507-Heterococcus_DN1.PRE.2
MLCALQLEDIAAGGGKKRIQQAYVEGLCWVMQYYYQKFIAPPIAWYISKAITVPISQHKAEKLPFVLDCGVSDWTWYYPFHYAPFASDLLDCDKFEIKFSSSEPFRPIEQLMAVLPPASAPALPPPCRQLMLEKQSPILDFYPEEVPCDPNGKPMPWLWVVLLPFIDETPAATGDCCHYTPCSRLMPLTQVTHRAYALPEHVQLLRSLLSSNCRSALKFSEEETARNSFGPSYIYVHSSTTLSQRILQAQAAAAGTGTRSDSGEKESSSESAIVMHSNGTSSGSDSSSSSGVWLPAAEFQGFSGTIKPVKDPKLATPVGAVLVAPTKPIGALEDVKQALTTALYHATASAALASSTTVQLQWHMHCTHLAHSTDTSTTNTPTATAAVNQQC